MTIQLKSADKLTTTPSPLGEVLMRIDPGQVPTARARTARIWHGGGETNGRRGVELLLRLAAAVITALVDDGIGRNIENQLREAGLDTGHIIWFNNGGKGQFSHRRQGDFAQWDQLHLGRQGPFAFGDRVLSRPYPGVRNRAGRCGLGSSLRRVGDAVGLAPAGFTPCSRRRRAALALEAMQKAGEQGAGRSFDLNYRSKVEPDKERAESD